MRKEYEENMQNKIQTVLFEEETEIEGEKYFVGHNERYVKFAKKSNGEDLTNQIRQVMATVKTNDGIIICN